MSKVRWVALLGFAAVLGSGIGDAQAQKWDKKAAAAGREMDERRDEEDKSKKTSPTAARTAAPSPGTSSSTAPKAPPAAKLDWTQSYVQAARISRQQDKVILAYFAGSDWCEWTKKLDREVMSTPMFVEWAKTNVVPLKIDFPSPDTPQQRSVAKQNDLLSATYNVAKVPTILFLNSDGEVIDRVGYDGAFLRETEKRGEPVEAIAKFNAILANRPTGQQVKEFAFLEATSITEKNGQPILLLITKPDSKNGTDMRDRLLKSGKFAKFVNTNSSFVNLSWPDEKDESEQAKWFRTFADAHKLGPAPIQVVMLTAGGRKLQHRVLTISDIDPLINNIAQQLPRFDYTGNWITDYRKAQSIAAQSGRDILLSFTSLDSSEWCQKLDAEIYQQEAFKEYARKNLVLLQVDFPKTKEQSAELKLQNQGLAESFNIRGYPTIIFVNPKGQKFGTAKYMPGGPEALIKELEDLRRRDFDRRTLTSDQVEVKKK